MRIKEIVYQHRRDFTAIYECEFCGDTFRGSGYDDLRFHNNVIPTMVCEVCGKSTREEGTDYRPLQPKYPEGFQI